MSVIIGRGVKRLTPPPKRAKIDNTDPLAKGFLCGWIPAIHGPGPIPSLKSGDSMTATGTVVWERTAGGWGAKSAQNGNNGLTSNVVFTVQQTSVSLFALIIPYSYQTASPYISHIYGQEPGSADDVFLRFGDGTSLANDRPEFCLGFNKLVSTIGVATGSPVTVAGVSSPAGRYLYINGSLISSTTALTAGTLNFQASFGVYNGAYGTNRGFNGSGLAGYTWDRPLSDSEIMKLHLNPYCFLRY